MADYRPHLAPGTTQRSSVPCAQCYLPAYRKGLVFAIGKAWHLACVPDFVRSVLMDIPSDQPLLLRDLINELYVEFRMQIRFLEELAIEAARACRSTRGRSRAAEAPFTTTRRSPTRTTSRSSSRTTSKSSSRTTRRLSSKITRLRSAPWKTRSSLKTISVRDKTHTRTELDLTIVVLDFTFDW